MKVIIDDVVYVPKLNLGEDSSLYERALDVSFEFDGGNITVGHYLRELLQTLWWEREGFSGKRPFGNSSWEYDLITPLIRAGFIDGTLDEDGNVDKVDKDVAIDFVDDLILYVFREV